MFYEHLKVHSEIVGIRKFRPLPFGTGHALSVQANKGVYCTPRKTLDDLSNYSAWEIAYLYNGLAHPSDVPDIEFEEEWLGYWDSQVAAYVPTAIVQEIYEYLCDVFGTQSPQEYLPVPHHRFKYQPEPKDDYEITTTINPSIFQRLDRG